MKKIIALLVFMVSMAANAIDFVYVGSYTATSLKEDGKEFSKKTYDVIAEYDGDKITQVEIMTSGVGVTTNVSLLVDGKNLKKFHSSLVKLAQAFYKYEDIDMAKLQKDAFKVIEGVKFPKAKLKGVMTDHYSDFESYDVVGMAKFTPKFYYFRGNKFYSLYLQSIIEGMACAYAHKQVYETPSANKAVYPIFKYSFEEGVMQFGSFEDYEKFVNLMDPEYIMKRVEMKRKG